MAKQGNFAAFQQLRPLQGDISDDIKYWNEDRDAKRSQKTYEDELAYQKKQKLKEEKQARFDKYIKPLNNYETGSKSLNEFNARVISSATKEYLPLIQTLDNPNSTDEQKINAQLKLQNLQNLPQNLKNVTEQYTAQWDAYQKAKQTGLAWENTAMEKAFQSGFSTFQGGIDEQGMPLVAFVDKDGDGQNDLMAVQSYDEISQGMPLFDFQKKHNPEALAKSIAEDLGQSDVTTQNGYTTERIKAVRDEDKNTRVQTLLFGSDGNPTSVAKDALIRKGVDPSSATPDQLKEVEQEYTQLINTFLPEIKETDFDFTAQNNARKENRMQQESDLAQVTEAVDPSKQTWGEKKSEISGKSVGLSNVKIGAIKGKEENVSDATVKNFAFNKNGDMLLDVEVVKTKAVSETEYKELEEKFEEGNLTGSLKEAFLSMQNQKPGSRRISQPGTNEKKVITVSPEDQADIARQAGTSIQSLKEKAGYGESPKPQYKGVDENGDPIFE